MSFIESRKFVKASTLGTIAMWTYFISLDFFGDSRMADGALYGEEMHWWEFPIMIQGMLLIFMTFFSSIVHAFKSDRNKWGLFIFFLWPLSYIYAWKYGRNK